MVERLFRRLGHRDSDGSDDECLESPSAVRRLHLNGAMDSDDETSPQPPPPLNRARVACSREPRMAYERYVERLRQRRSAPTGTGSTVAAEASSTERAPDHLAQMARHSLRPPHARPIGGHNCSMLSTTAPARQMRRQLQNLGLEPARGTTVPKNRLRRSPKLVQQRQRPPFKTCTAASELCSFESRPAQPP